jgi:hypothetical protein
MHALVSLPFAAASCRVVALGSNLEASLHAAMHCLVMIPDCAATLRSSGESLRGDMVSVLSESMLRLRLLQAFLPALERVRLTHLPRLFRISVDLHLLREGIFYSVRKKVYRPLLLLFPLLFPLQW